MKLKSLRNVFDKNSFYDAQYHIQEECIEELYSESVINVVWDEEFFVWRALRNFSRLVRLREEF